MEKLKWKTEKRKIKDLIPADYNPRQMTEKQAKDLRKSLEKFDLVEIPAIDTDGTILAGHQRLTILKELGRGNEEIDVRVPSRKLTENEAKEYNLRSNKNTGEWDMEKLFAMPEGLLKEVGWDDKEIQKLIDGHTEATEDDYDTEEGLKLPCRVVLGDIWQLGSHRLMCGDSTRKEDVDRLMDGEKADLAHNDPPYGMKKEKDGVLNDNLNFDELNDFNQDWIPLQFSFLKPNGSWYCWGIDEPLMDIYSNILKPLIRETKVTFRNLITWDKGNGQGQNSELTRSYATADEKCLFVMLGVQGFSNNKDQYYEGWEPIRQHLASSIEKAGITRQDIKRVTGVDMYSHWFSKSQWVFIPEKHYRAINDAFGCFEKTYLELKEMFNTSRAYFDNTHDNMNNVWHFERTGGSEREMTGGHATPKPLSLCCRAIKSSSPVGGLVLDFFVGSGSTLIACEQTGRICYGMEIDPKYCTVILDRWEKLTGGKAEKVQ